jgi:hypothetical protein
MGFPFLCRNVITSAFCPQSSSQTDIYFKTLPTPQQQPENHFLNAGMVFKWIFRNTLSALFGLSAAVHHVEHGAVVLFTKGM